MPEPVEDLVGVLAEERRALYLDRRVGELDRRADLDVTAAGRAAQRRAGLTAARGVAGARHRIAELLVWVFGQRTAHQALLIAHLDPAQIQHGVGHRDLDPLAPTGALALIERGEDAGDRM